MQVVLTWITLIGILRGQFKIQNLEFKIASPADRLLRKEVIQPQVPLRLPCYDFTPVTDHSLGRCLPEGLAHALRDQSTPVV